MRACWLYGEFGDYKFKISDHIRQVIDLIYQCFFDSELPVKYTAATSIHKLLVNEEANRFLKPGLKSILQQYLNLMKEIDSEELVNALEEVVSHFKEDIGPFAIELCEQLVSAYQRLI